MKHHPDFVIIGAGIVGVCIALELKSRFPDASITVLEKEQGLAKHASGRNSGVLHAGFYYGQDSLKARFCRDGNAAMTAFCQENGLRIRRCGKLVVARDEQEQQGLDVLLERGARNGVEVQGITAEEAREIEPRVKTLGRALWSPTTSTVDPAAVLSTLATRATERGVEISTGQSYKGRKGDRILTENSAFSPGFVINAAGAYADKIARDFGQARNLFLLPFKGLYLYRTARPETLRTHIYPVPDFNYPFLGVHFTLTADGLAKIGPTAVPAFWREQYRGLDNFSLSECLETIAHEFGLFLKSGFDFKHLAAQEFRKMLKSVLVNQASSLLDGVRRDQFTKWGAPGIRAQLYDIEQRKLVMDFCTRSDEKSFHVLNAVSPAFTSAMPFAEYCCDLIMHRINTNSSGESHGSDR